MVEGFIEYVKSIDPAYRCRPVNRGNYCEVNVNGLRALKVCQVLYADSTSKLERKFSLAMQLITLETVKLDTLRVKQAERHLRNKATEEKQKQLTIKRQEKADLLKLKQEKLRNKEVQDNKCKDCGKITLSRKSARCPSCHQLHTRKVKDRPSKEELLALVSSKSYVSVGKMFGVSDNAIRKWLR
jgi:predicted Zn-ribbon and HTH transcriptional regulator